MLSPSRASLAIAGVLERRPAMCLGTTRDSGTPFLGGLGSAAREGGDTIGLAPAAVPTRLVGLAPVLGWIGAVVGSGPSVCGTAGVEAQGDGGLFLASGPPVDLIDELVDAPVPELVFPDRVPDDGLPRPERVEAALVFTRSMALQKTRRMWSQWADRMASSAL